MADVVVVAELAGVVLEGGEEIHLLGELGYLSRDNGGHFVRAEQLGIVHTIVEEVESKLPYTLLNPVDSVLHVEQI